MKYSYIYKYGYGNGLSQYRPYIQYKWNTTIDDKGNRLLVDSGVAPKFPAAMYSGRGIKFNGIDQALVTDIYPKAEWTKQTISCEVKEQLEARYELLAGHAYSPSAPVGSINITNFNLNDGAYNDYTINIHYEYDGVDYALTLALSEGFKGTITGSLDFTTGEMKGYLDGKLIKSKIFNGLIGKSPNSFGYPFTIGAGTSGGEAARGYLNKTVGNVMFLTDILSDSEVQYLHSNPEKFLYREDNILKSKILPQEKIDAVEFYAPMCETDGYIRDYSKYSEGTNFDSLSYYQTSISGAGNTIDVSGNVTTIHIETPPDYAFQPYVRAKNDNQVNGEMYYISVTIKVTSGIAHLNSIATEYPNGTSSEVDLNVGTYEYTFIGNYYESKSAIEVNFDGTVNNFDATITFNAIKKLTGIYTITNYTSDQNVKQLSTGLQTCFWERDILGVPNRLVESGTIGDPLTNTSNIDTPYVLPFDTDFMLETVYYNPYSSGGKFLIFGSDYTKGLLIGKHSVDGVLYLRLFGAVYYPVGYSNQFNHIVLVFTASTKTVDMYINGELKHSEDTTISDVSTDPIQLLRFGTGHSASFELRLFNIHTELQDPLELYNNAVKKGLLQ